jgi:hypothetical protein
LRKHANRVDTITAPSIFYFVCAFGGHFHRGHPSWLFVGASSFIWPIEIEGDVVSLLSSSSVWATKKKGGKKNTNLRISCWGSWTGWTEYLQCRGIRTCGRNELINCRPELFMVSGHWPRIKNKLNSVFSFSFLLPRTNALCRMTWWIWWSKLLWSWVAAPV